MVHLGNASELRVSHSIDFMANGEIKVFFDPYSQPSRAVLLLMNINKIRYEPMQLNLCNGKDIFVGNYIRKLYFYNVCR